MVIHVLLERALSSLQLRAQVTWLRPGDSGCSALSAGEEDTQWHLPFSAALFRGRGQSPRSQRSFTRRLWFSAAIEAVWDEAEKPSRLEPLGYGVAGTPPPPTCPACLSRVVSELLQCPGWGDLSWGPVGITVALSQPRSTGPNPGSQ